MSDAQLYTTAAVAAAIFIALLGLAWTLRRHSERLAIISTVVAVLSLLAAIVQIVVAVKPAPPDASGSKTASPGPSEHSTASPNRGPGAASGCQANDSPAFAKATPEQAGGLTFCPTQINGGNLPFSGSLKLEGKIIGPDAERRRLVLFVRIDPTTVDTCGKKGGPGRFLITDVNLYGDASGNWSYIDNFGNYPPGVTFGRTYDFARASESTIDNLVANRDEWGEDGIIRLPTDVEVLSSFTVPPGQPDSQAACAG